MRRYRARDAARGSRGCATAHVEIAGINVQLIAVVVVGLRSVYKSLYYIV